MTEDQLRELEQLRCPNCGRLPEDLDDCDRLCCGRWTTIGADSEFFVSSLLAALRRAEELLGPVGGWGTP